MSVYTMGGPHSGAEKNINKRLSILNPKLRKHTKKITQILTEALSKPNRTNAYWNNVIRDLNAQYAALYKVYQEWAKVNIPGVYKDSLVEINKQIIKMANVAAVGSKTVTQILNSQLSKNINAALYQDALSSWSGALSAGKTNMTRLTRMTQQALIEEWTIDRAVGAAIESGDLRNFPSILSQRSPQYKALLEAAQNERYLQAGARKYSPEYYAEMVSRVKFHEAQSYAALAQAANYGTDLMVVSSHNTDSEICQQYEGKIFSISGKSKKFPLLTARPPYHVNCLHLIFPQFQSALEASGTLDEFSDFSKNKTDKPPQPSNFVPVSDREEEE